VALAGAGFAAPAQSAVADDTYEVTIRTAGSGSVSGAGTFSAGETVEVTALPAESQVWGGWTSD